MFDDDTKNSSAEPLERYTYKTGTDGHTRVALRLTNTAKRELEKQREAMGMVKTLVSLPGGRTGSVWRRP